MPAQKILVIDDCDLMRESMSETLRANGYHVLAFAEAGKALATVRDRSVDLVITDLKMPGMSGLDLMKVIHDEQLSVPVILVSAHGTIHTAVEAMKLGAQDFVIKPFEPEQLVWQVQKAFENIRLKGENDVLRCQITDLQPQSIMVGQSSTMTHLRDLCQRAAPTTASVLILGESGTGKEVLAREIHNLSQRADAPFLAVNCAALSAGVLESELFGHEKGAFTGATETRKGRFELAEGGTLLLDEITEMDLNLQAKLLRVLQERSFERVGSSKTIKVDVRVVATSNRNMEEAIQEGCLREDLYYRLNVVNLTVPPLRERAEDIPLLAEHFLKEFLHRESQSDRSLQSLMSAEQWQAMLTYSWPGNVRELRNALERAVVLGDFQGLTGQQVAAKPPTSESVEMPSSDLTIEEMEKVLISRALEKHGWHRVNTALALGIGERTLRDKIKRLQIPKPARTAGLPGRPNLGRRKMEVS